MHRQMPWKSSPGRQVVDHYADVFFRDQLIAGGTIFLTEQDRQDIVAFLGRL